MPYKWKPIYELSEKYIDKFWNRVAITANIDSCWEWMGTSTGVNYKYGCMSVGKTTPYLAHRLSYFIHHNQDPKEMLVCHTCDNPKCVNPKHLFLGTSKDNLRDMVKKGRGLTGEFLIEYMKTHPKIQNGESNFFAKLTSDKVMEIREKILHNTKRGKYKELGEQYNVSGEAISLIVRRKRWNHI